MSLLVVGSVALDTVATPQQQRDEILGGSASFFSSVASLVGPVRLVAVVGDDFPEEHVGFLASRGVDLAGLQREPGRTFRWSGRYLDNLVDRETIDTQLNVFEHFRPRLPDSYRDSRYVFLANIDPHLQLEVLGQVRQPRLVALDTMNFWMRGAYLEALHRVLRRIDAVFLNDEEARLLAGEQSLLRAAARVREMGPRQVIIKRGDAGAMLFSGEDGIFWAPAYPVAEVVDPTGAGDSFAGGMMAYLARTGDLSPAGFRRGVIFGTSAASFAVEAFSVDRFRNLTHQALIERCTELAMLVHFEPVGL